MLRNRRWMMLAAAMAFHPSPQSHAADPPAKVAVLETPTGGIQPQAALDSEGAIHLVYFRGESARGDVFYTSLAPGKTQFSEPLRVNSQPGSAIAIGTIRGAQIALGRGGRVHVAWNGSQAALPANPIVGTPMLYARSNPERTAFERQRNLMRRTYHLDGGGSVAADGEGKVYVGWHGRDKAAPEGERGRRFWMAKSTDDGETFAEEQPALSRETGACACCGTRALADARGTVYFLYRAATNNTDRDITLLTSRDGGSHFEGAVLHPWRLSACPMSSESLAEGPEGVVAAWETNGQVHFSRLDPKTGAPSKPIAPPGSGERKHPAVAVNDRGETILVWAEGTGWQRGGTLVWRVFDASGRATRELGRVENGIPVWGLPTVVARPGGGFAIIH